MKNTSPRQWQGYVFSFPMPPFTASFRRRGIRSWNERTEIHRGSISRCRLRESRRTGYLFAHQRTSTKCPSSPDTIVSAASVPGMNEIDPSCPENLRFGGSSFRFFFRALGRDRLRRLATDSACAIRSIKTVDRLMIKRGTTRKRAHKGGSSEGSQSRRNPLERRKSPKPSRSATAT